MDKESMDSLLSMGIWNIKTNTHLELETQKIKPYLDLLNQAERIIDKSEHVIKLQSEIIAKYEKLIARYELPWYKKLFK